jgi:hypothetical protein
MQNEFLQVKNAKKQAKTTYKALFVLESTAR